MPAQDVDFAATTAAVLKGFDPRFTTMVIELLEQRNAVTTATDGNSPESYAKLRNGYGLLVLVDEDENKQPVTITTEFLVPSNDLAASFMVMWRRWCDKKDIHSNTGLLSLMKKVSEQMHNHAALGNKRLVSNPALGLMGAVLDNYPEIINSMRWSVDHGFVPCLVIANENNTAKCGVCYGGRYMTT